MTCYQIPSIPEKTLNSNEPEIVSYRLKCFQDFLNFVVKSRTMIYSPELLAFLSYPDSKFDGYKDVEFTNFQEKYD